jgi:lactate dehydrogenase-like 2-hydroxyacid dehydrogenase
MSWTVVSTAPALNIVGESTVGALRQAGCQVTLAPPTGPFPSDELLRYIAGADAVIAGVDRFDAAILESGSARNLKIISRWGVGYDAVDLVTATKLGILVTNTPGLLDEAVADYTFALLLAAARGVGEGHHTMRQGQWSPQWGEDVNGKTLGIIGYGRIGRSVAKRAAGFGMRILAYDLRPPREPVLPPAEFLPLDDLLAQSDYICLHAALTPDNRGMIGRGQLARMKRSAFFINTARGALVDEVALADALHAGTIGGAALDAFAVEPLPPDHPLRTAPRLLLTPHQASFGRDTGRAVCAAAAEAVLDAQAGRAPKFVVNKDVLQSPALRVKFSS